MRSIRQSSAKLVASVGVSHASQTDTVSGCPFAHMCTCPMLMYMCRSGGQPVTLFHLVLRSATHLSQRPKKLCNCLYVVSPVMQLGRHWVHNQIAARLQVSSHAWSRRTGVSNSKFVSLHQD
eukprot:jgi/Ulvmu1/4718/UM020_0001.1